MNKKGMVFLWFGIAMVIASVLFISLSPSDKQLSIGHTQIEQYAIDIAFDRIVQQKLFEFAVADFFDVGGCGFYEGSPLWSRADKTCFPEFDISTWKKNYELRKLNLPKEFSSDYLLSISGEFFVFTALKPVEIKTDDIFYYEFLNFKVGGAQLLCAPDEARVLLDTCTDISCIDNNLPSGWKRGSCGGQRDSGKTQRFCAYERDFALTFK